MSFFKKIGKSIKKVVSKVGKYAAPVAALAAPFIPGIGGAISGIISKVGGALGGSSAKSVDSAFTGPPDPANPTEGQQVQINAGGNSWAKAIGDAVPAAIAAGGNYLGAQSQNVASAQQAQRQMDFQADQTSTSYQRAVADMKAAGLNPMLAYSQGGAASGGGAQASMVNELGAGANSAQSAMLARQQIAQSAATVDNIQADTINKEEATENIRADTVHKYALGASEGTRNHEIAQRVSELALRNQLSAATQGYSISSAKSAADFDDARAKGEKYSLAEKGAWSKFYGSAVGSKYPYAAKATELSNSAANVFRKFIPFTNN